MEKTLTVNDLIRLLTDIKDKDRKVLLYDQQASFGFNIINIDTDANIPVYIDFDSDDTSIDF